MSVTSGMFELSIELILFSAFRAMRLIFEGLTLASADYQLTPCGCPSLVLLLLLKASLLASDVSLTFFLLTMKLIYALLMTL